MCKCRWDSDRARFPSYAWIFPSQRCGAALSQTVDCPWLPRVPCFSVVTPWWLLFNWELWISYARPPRNKYYACHTKPNNPTVISRIEASSRLSFYTHQRIFAILVTKSPEQLVLFYSSKKACANAKVDCTSSCWMVIVHGRDKDKKNNSAFRRGLGYLQLEWMSFLVESSAMLLVIPRSSFPELHANLRRRITPRGRFFIFGTFQTLLICRKQITFRARSK